MIEITVHNIRGTCPLYKKDDKITIKNSYIIMGKAGA